MNAERLWIGTLTCADCGTVLNTTNPLPDSDKGKVAMTSPLMAGKCPKGCRSTFSDLNMNTKLEWKEDSDGNVRP